MHAARTEVNYMLRRPGLFGGASALSELFDLEDLHRTWRDRLRRLLPDNLLDYALTSGLVEIARERGWLDLDRALTTGEYRALRAAIGPFAAQDHTWRQVVAAFGEPSLLIGGTNPYFGKTLGYATADPGEPMVCFHLWNGDEPGAEPSWPPPHADPLLLAVHHGADPFPQDFRHTPAGLRRRPPEQQRPA